MVLQHHGLTKPYLLGVGTLEPRKGLHRLVPAFVSLFEEGHLKNHHLVLAGDRGWKDGAIAQLIRSHESIRPIGFVDDDSLAALYTGAEALVFPSSYEGFGMPVLEARACGTPVVTTDIPELREAGGDGAIYVAPTVEGVRGGIMQAVQAGRRIPINRAEYTWQSSAAIFAEVLAATQAVSLARSA